MDASDEQPEKALVLMLARPSGRAMAVSVVLLRKASDGRVLKSASEMSRAVSVVLSTFFR